MNRNIKYGVVAALTMAAFVAGPVSTVSAYTTITIPASESGTNKAETKYQYTADEINAMKTGSLVFGSSKSAVYNKTYDGEELSAKDVYIKYTYNDKTLYAQVSAARDTAGKDFKVVFYDATVTSGKLSADADDESTDTAVVGYYGVEVTDGSDNKIVSAGISENDAYAINVKQATVSGSTISATAAEDKTLIYGDVVAGDSDGFTAKIGSVAVDAKDVLIFTTAAARTSYIEGKKTAAELETAKTKIADGKTLNAGTYYTYYTLTTTDDIAYSGSAKGTTHEFTGTLTVSPFNFTNYYKVAATTDPVPFVADGAEIVAKFTEKDDVTIPGATTKPANLYIEDTTADGYDEAKNAEDTADYKVTYKNNTKAGTATATITGMNNFTGTATVNFTVKAAEINDIADLEATYTGSAVEVKTINAGGKDYTSGFTVSYAGAHTTVADSGVKVTVKGNGTSIITPTDGIEKTLTIKALDLSDATKMTAADWAKADDTTKNTGKYIVISSYAYSTSAPSVKVYVDGNEVSSSVYKVEFEAATKAGAQATLTLKGVDAQVTAGNVSTATGTYTFTTTKSLETATVSGVAKTYTYNGESKEPVVTVKAGTETLVEGVDYVVSYKNNLKVGTGSVVITGMGDDYKGSTKTVNFYIDPAKSSISKITVGAKKATVKVKNGKGATGVEIAYRVKGTSKWTKVRTTVGSKVLKNLKKGKQYQVTVRSYTKNSAGKVTNYSGWSATKTTAKIK